MKEERWQILAVDLRHPLSGIDRPPEAAGIHLEIWHGSLPLGQLWLPCEILPIQPPELAEEIARAIAPTVGDRIFPRGFRAPLPVVGDNPARDTVPDWKPLAILDRPLERIPADEPPPALRVSVIICTRNRPETLEHCLSSLERLDPAPDEILVVDNGSGNDSTKEIAEKFPGVTYLHEPRAGLSRARNKGIWHAKGEIIAWTDDDTTAHPGWIGAIRSTFADSSLSGMTGLVFPGSLETAAQLYFERDFGGFQRGFRRFTLDKEFFETMKNRGVPTWLAGAGANMAFRRQVFDELGQYDERLGAGASGCSEDSEYWYRMLAAGKSIRYEPAAVVWHFHRIADADFQHQMEEYMRGHVAALLVQYEKTRHIGNLRRLFLSLPRYYWSIFRHGVAAASRGTLASELRGCFRGILYYLRNKC